MSNNNFLVQNQNSETNLLLAKQITKAFPGVQALKGVDFLINQNEVHALLGDNGAGKSTLVKILTGVLTPDSGQIYFNGKQIQLKTPNDAFSLGIGVVHQEINLFPELDIAKNVMIDNVPLKESWFGHAFKVINWDKMYEDAKRATDSVALNINLKDKASSLGSAKAQMAEIAKGVSRNMQVFFLDEPTSSLSPEERKELFRLIRELKKYMGIVYISHRLEEIIEISDRITILRNGEVIANLNTKETNIDTIINLVAGRTMSDRKKETLSYKKDKVSLEVKDFSRSSVFKNINFKIKVGEICGIAGLVGSGRTEILRSIIGADSIEKGDMFLFGEKIFVKKPSDALSYGIVLSPEDRKLQGLFPMSYLKNFAVGITNAESMKKRIFKILYKTKWKQIEKIAIDYKNMLNIVMSSIYNNVLHLSGGNQQKVILARWLAVEPKVLLLDEPTKGMSVSSKEEIYDLMRQIASRGVSIIMVSSEFKEILNICERIFILNDKTIIGDVKSNKIDEESLLKMVSMKNYLM